MHGLHLTADLHDCQCDARWLVDAQALGALCVDAVTAVGLRAVGQLFYAFPATPRGPGGVTATVLLAESHLCVHTWPELRSATMDVYVCNVSADHSNAGRALIERLIAHFDPAHIERHELMRGVLPLPPRAGEGWEGGYSTGKEVF